MKGEFVLGVQYKLFLCVLLLCINIIGIHSNLIYSTQLQGPHFNFIQEDAEATSGLFGTP